MLNNWITHIKSRIRTTLGRLVCVCLGLTILYHESKSIPFVLSIPWVHGYRHVSTMSPCLYHESMSVIWVHVYTMSPCLYNEFMSIPGVHVYTMSQCLTIRWFYVYTISPCLYHKSMSIPKVFANNKSLSKLWGETFKLQKYKKIVTKHCQVEVQKENFRHHFQTIGKLAGNEFNFHTEVVNSI